MTNAQMIQERRNKYINSRFDKKQLAYLKKLAERGKDGLLTEYDEGYLSGFQAAKRNKEYTEEIDKLIPIARARATIKRDAVNGDVIDNKIFSAEMDKLAREAGLRR